MITQFKIFEEWNIDEFLPIYKVGDYVLIWSEERKCKVVEIVDDPMGEYNVETIITGQRIIIPLMYDNIKRKMTPEEIEQFKLFQQIDKYNL